VELTLPEPVAMTLIATTHVGLAQLREIRERTGRLERKASSTRVELKTSVGGNRVRLRWLDQPGVSRLHTDAEGSNLYMSESLALSVATSIADEIGSASARFTLANKPVP